MDFALSLAKDTFSGKPVQAPTDVANLVLALLAPQGSFGHRLLHFQKQGIRRFEQRPQPLQKGSLGGAI
jgi:hypothetical protein